MARSKQTSYRWVISKILAWSKLSAAERESFEKMAKQMSKGKELTEHQKLWVDAVRMKMES